VVRTKGLTNAYGYRATLSALAFVGDGGPVTTELQGQALGMTHIPSSQDQILTGHESTELGTVPSTRLRIKTTSTGRRFRQAPDRAGELRARGEVMPDGRPERLSRRPVPLLCEDCRVKARPSQFPAPMWRGVTAPSGV
jgi:hypothetical protein